MPAAETNSLSVFTTDTQCIFVL